MWAKHPELLNSTKFRKHIATTLQFMTMQPQEMEQVATFMGHTEKTHAEFNRLPQDIFQTAKVAKVLLLLEKGKGKEFIGKSLNEIDVEEEAYISESSDDENNNNERPTKYPITQINDMSQVADSNSGKIISKNYEEGHDSEIEHNEVKSHELPEWNKSRNSI
ncbi:hypothetical protein NQ314_013931 [Rhamnusium bicolor]|uniref:Uncharacterized protein n=1 Tax=Rhamnusium bicolor TaxID=1586634 RepID=A0AAV8X4W6_9CUCU|nr:hypothetical protein NQ314_013931 [Rhamnusium bicolor]